jgi:ubiquinone/menaquinone biosynthesis C-methylase UbiE
MPLSSPPRVLPTRDGYDLWAQVYDGDGNPLLALEAPHVSRLLGEPAGRSVADVGCGTGRHAVALAQAGARVTAVDFSGGMLSQAKSKPGAEQVRFVAHDLSQPLPFEDGSFDRVLCCLVLEHVQDLTHAFRELGRICKPEGRVVVTCMHPAMMLKGVQARFTDPASGLETRPESHAHQVSDYVMGAVRAGLPLREVSEHLVDDALARQLPRAQKYLGWPMLLVMSLGPAPHAAF